MIRPFTRVALMLAAVAAASQPIDGQRSADSVDNVMLITLDGARVEEMFGGLNLDILRSTLKEGEPVENQAVYQRFWADTLEQRREKLMPFFWKTLMTQYGSIAGNQS